LGHNFSGFHSGHSSNDGPLLGFYTKWSIWFFESHPKDAPPEHKNQKNMLQGVKTQKKATI
jgi:hypothetical protein